MTVKKITTIDQCGFTSGGLDKISMLSDEKTMCTMTSQHLTRKLSIVCLIPMVYW
ncbi:MAG: hypothetical protein WBO36_13375 [Saprospiraceae bacterium]